MLNAPVRLVEHKEIRADREPELLARWLFHAVHAPPTTRQMS